MFCFTLETLDIFLNILDWIIGSNSNSDQQNVNHKWIVCLISVETAKEKQKKRMHVTAQTFAVQLYAVNN